MKEEIFKHGYYETEFLKTLGFKHIGDNVKIAKNCTIVGFENISIGDNVQIDGNCYLIAQSGFITIGKYIHINRGCYFSASGGILMEDFSGLASNVTIYSATDDYLGASLTGSVVPSKYRILHKGVVRIGKHVLIGTGSVILPNTTLSEGCSLGALSLVTSNKTLEEWTVYYGNPVKKYTKRKTNALDLERQLENER